ncbi:MAG: M28 family peptidase [Holophagales bacterium]|nr:M28 family peptidase [Holophagales bacterium]
MRCSLRSSSLPGLLIVAALATSAPALGASGWDRLACFAVAALPEGAPGDVARRAVWRRAVGEPEVRIVAGASEVLCVDASSRTSEELGAALAAAGVQFGRSWAGVDRGRLVAIRGIRRAEAESLGRVLAGAGRGAVVELAPERSPDDLVTPFHASEGAERERVPLREISESVGEVVILARLVQPESAGPVTPALDRLVGGVDADRWLAAATTLAGWNRWTRGSQILLARDWLAARFGELRGAEVWTESFPVTSSTGWNVFARIPGTQEPEAWYLIGGHYDSISQTPSVAAPGAEDNASGCAGVLEIARAVAETPTPRTLLFACYSGEEQGLYGSKDHAADLVASGGDAGFGGGLIFDMIGFDGDDTLDVLLETGAIGQGLIDLFAAASADYAGLVVSTSLNPFGSDHVPYLQRGLPALLAIENDWDDYGCYHDTCDLPANLSTAMGGGIVRMGAAGIGRLAGLAEVPGLLFRDGFERGSWSAWIEVVEP